MTSLESVPEVSDIHEKLSKPEALAEALTNGEHAELVFLLEWLYNYLPSCQTVDVDGSATVLIDRAVRSESEADLTDDLAALFTKVLTRVIQKTPASKRAACFQQVIDKSPLSVSERILLDAAAEQGKWVMRPEMVKASEAQLIPDSEAVDTAIATWSEKVRQSIESGRLSEESRMHSILYRFAQLNFAYGEIYAAVGKICSTDDGLRKFLSTHVKDSPFNTIDSYGVVEDAPSLADRIKKSTLKDEYSWLAELLATPEWDKAIGEQSTRLKGLKRGNQSEAPEVAIGTVSPQA